MLGTPVVYVDTLKEEYNCRVKIQHRMSKCAASNAAGTSDMPDNQQERLIKSGWIVGFIEGEGCFSIGFIKQPNRLHRSGYKTGLQVWHEFAVTQGASSFSALEEIRSFFGVGKIYLNKRYDNHKEHLYRYVVRKREDLLRVVIPFFSSQTMRTVKKKQFERFVKVLRMMQRSEHLSREGLETILHIAQQMNVKKDRGDLIKILREHTP